MVWKLFLTSAGLPAETRDYFIKLLPKIPQEIIVAFIPTASDPEKNKSYVQRDKNSIKEIGMKILEVDLKSENKDSLLSKLSKCDVIYVEGGNTYYLLDYVRKSGFNKVIKILLDDGKIYVGVSAGSYLACPTIEMATWKHQDRNRYGITDFTGLDLVPFMMSVHYKNEYKEIIKQNTEKLHCPVFVLTDKQAVLCVGKRYEVVGVGEKIIYNKENSGAWFKVY